MAQQRARPPSGDPLAESAGCCGLIARLLGVVVLVAALATLGILLITGSPDRWQGVADPNAHPLALVIDPRHPQWVYVGAEQGYILVSRDGGQSWQQMRQGLPPNTPVSALTMLPDSAGDSGAARLLAGTSKGAYVSTDGGSAWRSAGPGMPSPSIVDAVSALPDGTLLAGTAGAGVYAMASGSASWRPSDMGLPAQSDIYAFLPLPQRGHVLAALISGGVYASQDDGMTWMESDRGLSGAPGVNVFTLLAVPGQGGSGTDDRILAGTSQGVSVSRDLGATWTASSAGIGTTRVISLARDPLAPTDVFAGADNGVYQSQDGGATWHTVGYGLPSGLHVGAVGVVHPARSGQVILASVDRLYRYPGQWPLATEPWRALGFGALIVLALALIAYVVWQARSLLAS